MACLSLIQRLNTASNRKPSVIYSGDCHAYIVICCLRAYIEQCMPIGRVEWSHGTIESFYLNGSVVKYSEQTRSSAVSSQPRTLDIFAGHHAASLSAERGDAECSARPDGLFSYLAVATMATRILLEMVTV